MHDPLTSRESFFFNPCAHPRCAQAGPSGFSNLERVSDHYRPNLCTEHNPSEKTPKQCICSGLMLHRDVEGNMCAICCERGYTTRTRDFRFHRCELCVVECDRSMFLGKDMNHFRRRYTLANLRRVTCVKGSGQCCWCKWRLSASNFGASEAVRHAVGSKIKMMCHTCSTRSSTPRDHETYMCTLCKRVDVSFAAKRQVRPSK